MSKRLSVTAWAMIVAGSAFVSGFAVRGLLDRCRVYASKSVPEISKPNAETQQPSQCPIFTRLQCWPPNDTSKAGKQ